MSFTEEMVVLMPPMGNILYLLWEEEPGLLKHSAPFRVVSWDITSCFWFIFHTVIQLNHAIVCLEADWDPPFQWFRSQHSHLFKWTALSEQLRKSHTELNLPSVNTPLIYYENRFSVLLSGGRSSLQHQSPSDLCPEVVRINQHSYSSCTEWDLEVFVDLPEKSDTKRDLHSGCCDKCQSKDANICGGFCAKQCCLSSYSGLNWFV